MLVFCVSGDDPSIKTEKLLQGRKASNEGIDPYILVAVNSKRRICVHPC